MKKSQIIASVLGLCLIFGTLFYVHQRFEGIYSEVACPVCGALKTAVIKNDSVMDVQHYKCYNCELEFTISDAPNN